MKPYEELGRSTTVDGTRLTLMQRGDDYFVEIDGEVLMSNLAPGSERALSELGCQHLLTAPAPRVLIGGLGMGFTLGAALDILPPTATVVVAEVFHAIVDWNRKFCFEGVEDRLDDPRVEVAMGDIVRLLRNTEARFDAVLLDVDNGPAAFSLESNHRLYDRAGLASIRRAMRPGGMLAVWSCEPARAFLTALSRAGFAAEAHNVRSRGRKGERHTIFCGRLPAA